MRRLTTLLVLASIALSACGANEATPKSGDDSLAISNPLPTTTVDGKPKIDDVPEHPDAKYVEEVMSKVWAIRGDIRRDVWGTQSMSHDTYNRIADMYDERQGEIAAKIWSKASMEPHPGAREPLGNERLENIEVLDSHKGCAMFSAANDTSQIITTPQPDPKPVFLFEIRTFEGSHRTNPTPWKITYEGDFDPSQRTEYRCGGYLQSSH